MHPELTQLEDTALVVLATVGYRAADDHYANLAKVRYPKSELIETI